MFKAHFDGKDISPQEYIEEVHKGKLQCPCTTCRDDERFNPEMRFVREVSCIDGGEGLQYSTGLKTVARLAHFTTMPKQPHHPDCDAHIEHGAVHVKIDHALKNKKHILFNLNHLPKYFRHQFNLQVKEPRPDLISAAEWKKVHDYRPVSVNDTQDLIDAVDRTISKQGQSATQKLYVHWGPHVMAWDNFDCRNKPDMLESIYKSMVHCAKKYARPPTGETHPPYSGEHQFYNDFPRLITLECLQSFNTSAFQGVRGEEQHITLGKGRDRKKWYPLVPAIEAKRERVQEILQDAQSCNVIGPLRIHFFRELNAYNQDRPAVLGVHVSNTPQVGIIKPSDLSLPILHDIGGQVGWDFERFDKQLKAG